MQDVSQGAERIRIWPKKRGRNVPAEQKEQMEWFRQVQWAFKYLDPRTQYMFMEATKGTPLLPRDLFTMMLAGRWLEFVLPDNRVITSVQSQYDVSESLDVLGSVVGNTLIRGPDRWEVVPPLAGNRSGVIVRRTGTLSVPTGGTLNLIPWQAEDIDQANYWNIGAPNNIVIPFTGWYTFTLGGFKNVGAVNFSEMLVQKNGVDIARQASQLPNNFAASLFNVSGAWYFTAGDILRCGIRNYGSTQTWGGLTLSVVGNA